MAKKTYSIEDIEKQTAGVECKKDASVLDEIPGAYKDIYEVMEFQSDLVKPIHVLKQIVCVKG
jgi:tRNA-splicing ligase RtcB